MTVLAVIPRHRLAQGKPAGCCHRSEVLRRLPDSSVWMRLGRQFINNLFFNRFCERIPAAAHIGSCMCCWRYFHELVTTHFRFMLDFFQDQHAGKKQMRNWQYSMSNLAVRLCSGRG